MKFGADVSLQYTRNLTVPANPGPAFENGEMATAVIIQGGGPTPVINATLVGAVQAARAYPGRLQRFLGSEHGLRGILKRRYFDLFALDDACLDRIGLAPAAALGSSRDRLQSHDMDQLLSEFKRFDVRYLFHIGGNGSMGTALDITAAAKAIGYEMQILGIPKTIDNDIAQTDHTPGYASAGRFYAHAVRDMGMDHRALPSPILICEINGRNVGWLVAATAFARNYEDDAPHLIYFPERRLPQAKLLADIESAFRRWGRVFVCICEGQLDENGNAFGADLDRPDNPQHRLASNLAHAVARLVTRELKLRARSERPSLLARSCSAYVSATDRSEAELAGRAAVHAAMQGENGRMVAFMRVDGSPVYRCETTLVDLEMVARIERQLPAEFMNRERPDVSEAFLQYARPLIGSIQAHERLGHVMPRPPG